MSDKPLAKQIATATKWSSITQIVSKIITPLTNMVLARILTPDAFGVIATVTMIVSFTEMFTDAGFQKYLIQKEFKGLKEKYQNANVAFWSNFILSIIILAIISVFNGPIANMVGNPGLGFVLIVASLQLPLTSFSSIQMSLYRRSFDFKTLFTVRVIGSLVPFIVTIPLALLGLDYWSLIIGMIAMQIFNAIFLTIKSDWKPKLFYDLNILKEMFSFSVWSFLEAITIWLCVWIDTFIISYYLNQYYLGIYKTSTIMVNSLLALVSSAIIPVFFAALSRLQHDDVQFRNMFYKFQRLIALFILPIGVGVLLYSDLATELILGSQWSEASGVVGVWALSRVILMVFGYTASEVYRAKGKPKLSFYAQFLHLIVLVPTCFVAIKYGFWTLVYARAFVVLQLVIVHFLFLQIQFKISTASSIRNTFPSILAVLLMAIVGYFMKRLSDSLVWTVITMLICIVIYFIVVLIFPKNRIEIISMFKNTLIKKSN